MNCWCFKRPSLWSFVIPPWDPLCSHRPARVCAAGPGGGGDANPSPPGPGEGPQCPGRGQGVGRRPFQAGDHWILICPLVSEDKARVCVRGERTSLEPCRGVPRTVYPGATGPPPSGGSGEGEGPSRRLQLPGLLGWWPRRPGLCLHLRVASPVCLPVQMSLFCRDRSLDGGSLYSHVTSS